MRPTHALFFLLPVALAAPLLTGCAAAPPPALAELGRPTRPLGPETAYPGLLATLRTGARTTIRYEITAGDGAPGAITRSLSPSESRDDAADVEWDIEGADGPEQVATVIRRESGALATARMRSFGRGVVTRFEPPLVLIPAELRAGEPVVTEVRMEVADLDTPDRITRTGSGVFTIELLGTEPVTGASGMTTTLLVRTTLESTFGPARVVRYTDRWFRASEPYGLVGESYSETVRVFGVITERRSRTAWLEGVQPIERP